MDKNASQFGSGTPPKGHWWSFDIGRSGFNLTATAGARDHLLGAEVWIGDDADKLIFDHFHAAREQYDQQFGEPLTWERPEDRKGSRIVIRRTGVDPFDKSRWEEYFGWYADKMTRLRECFANPIRELDLDGLAEASAEIEEALDR